MSRYLLAFTLLLVTLTGARATLAGEELQMLRAEGEAARQEIMAANVEFDEAQSAAFWPVFRDYRAAVGKLNDRTEALLKKFAAEYATLDDKQAKDLMKEMLDIEADRVALKQKYVKHFSKVLPAVKVARVLQVENKIDAIMAEELADAIPLVPASGS